MNPKYFYSLYGNSQKNIVVALKGDQQLLTFEGSLFDMVTTLNQMLRNFRLNGVVLYTLQEPTLKEMGLLALSRVQEVIFFRKSSLQVPEIWDSFKVHQVMRTYGRTDTESDSRSD